MCLRAAISKWNGKYVSDLEDIYKIHATQADFVNKLLGLIADGTYQSGATWLLKHYLDKGNSLRNSDVSRVYEMLKTLIPWQAKLHVLQSVEYLPIAADDAKLFEQFLRIAITDNNKFVRAWAYNGFYLLAKQYDEYRMEVEQFFNMAMNDEMPSVKARIRNILKTGF